MAKIQFSGNSINAYENLKHQYANGKLATSFTKGTGKSGGQLWEDYASNDMLDSLVSVYMNTDKLGSIDSFESKYSDYDYMDANTRIAAASTELYADRETLNTYERYKTDEDGNMLTDADGNLTYETEEYEDTEYNYYKSYLDSQAEYQKELYLATYKEKIEKNCDGFVGFIASAGSIVANLLSSTLSAFLNIPQLLGATFNSKIGTADYGEEFRSIMAEEWNPLAEMVADFDAKYTWWTDDYGDYNIWGEVMSGVTNTIGMMMPSLAGQGIASGISAIAGISSLSPTAANVLSNVAKVGSKVASMSYWVTMGVSTLQDYCRDENLQSVNVGALVAMAAATTTYEALVTKGMTTIFGGTQIDKMLFGSSTTGIASTLAGKITGEGGFKTAARTMIRIAVDGLKEGIEEVLQESGTALINNIASLYNEGFSSYGQFTGKQFGMAVGVSFLTTFITSGVSIVNNAVFGDSYTNNVVTDKNGNIVLNKDGTVKYKKMSWVDATDYKQAMSDLGTTMNKLSDMAKNKDLSAKDKLKITAAVDDITHMVEAIGEFYNANADDIANVLKIVDGLREVSSSKGKTTEYYTSTTASLEIRLAFHNDFGTVKQEFTPIEKRFGADNTPDKPLYENKTVVKIKNGYRVENADGTSTEYRRFKNGGYSVTHLPDYATIAQNILEELGILQAKGKASGLEAVATKQKLADAQVTEATAIRKDSLNEDLKNAGITTDERKSMVDTLQGLINSTDEESTNENDVEVNDETVSTSDKEINVPNNTNDSNAGIKQKFKTWFNMEGIDEVVVTNGNSGKSWIYKGILYVSKEDAINCTAQEILVDVANNEVKDRLANENRFRYAMNEMYKVYIQLNGTNFTREEFINALLINDGDIYFKMFAELSFKNDAIAIRSLINLANTVKAYQIKVGVVDDIKNKIVTDMNNSIQDALTRAAPFMSNYATLSKLLVSNLTNEQNELFKNSDNNKNKTNKVINLRSKLDRLIAFFNRSFTNSVATDMTVDDVSYIRELLKDELLSGENGLLGKKEYSKILSALDNLESYIKNPDKPYSLFSQLKSDEKQFIRLKDVLKFQVDHYENRKFLFNEFNAGNVLLNDFMFSFTDNVEELNTFLSDLSELGIVSTTDTDSISFYHDDLRDTQIYKQMLNTFVQIYNYYNEHGDLVGLDSNLKEYLMDLGSYEGRNTDTDLEILITAMFEYDDYGNLDVNDTYYQNALISFLTRTFYNYSNKNYILDINVFGEFNALSQYTVNNIDADDVFVFSQKGIKNGGTRRMNLDYNSFMTSTVSDMETRSFMLDPISDTVDSIISPDIPAVSRGSITLTDIINHPEYLNDAIKNDIKSKNGELTAPYVLTYIKGLLLKYNDAHNTSYRISIDKRGQYVLTNSVKARSLFSDTGIKIMSVLRNIHDRNNNLVYKYENKEKRATYVEQKLTEAGIKYSRTGTGKFNKAGAEAVIISINATEIFKNEILPLKLKDMKINLYITDGGISNSILNQRAKFSYNTTNNDNPRIEIGTVDEDFESSFIHELQHAYQWAYGRLSQSSLGDSIMDHILLDTETEFLKFVQLADELRNLYPKSYNIFLLATNQINDKGTVDNLVSRLIFAQWVLYQKDVSEREANGEGRIEHQGQTKTIVDTVFPVLNAIDTENSRYYVTTPNGNTYVFAYTNSPNNRKNLADVNNLTRSMVGSIQGTTGEFYIEQGKIGISNIRTQSLNEDKLLQGSFRKSSGISDIEISLNQLGTDGNWKSNNRYVSINTARNSNLRYYAYKDGIPTEDNAYLDENNKRIVIQMDPHLQDFIVNSDLSLLDPELTDLIQKGKLSYSHSETDIKGKYSIMQYIHDAKNINDYTFGQIMKYIFPDSKVKDFKTLQEFTDSYSASRNYAVLMVMRQTLGMDMDTIVDLSKGSGKGYIVLDKLYNTIAANEKFKPILEKYEIGYTQWSSKYDISENFNQNDLRMFILQNFDGTAGSLLAQYGIERWLMVHNFQSKRSKLQTTSMDRENSSDTKKNDSSTNMHEMIADESTLNQEDNILDMLSDISDDEMIRMIAEAMFVDELAQGKHQNLTIAQRQTKLNKGISRLESMYESGKISQTKLQNMYIAKVWNKLHISQTSTIAKIESGELSVVTDNAKDKDAVYIRSDKNIRDNIRNHVNRNIAPYINASNVGEFKAKYPDIPIVATVNEEGVARYQLDKSVWQGKSSEELKALEQRVKNAGTEMRIEATNNKVSKQLYNKIKRQLDRSNERLQRTQEKLASDKKVKTVKIKTNVEYDYEFEIASNVMMPDALRNMLNKQMSDVNFAKTDVKNISSDNSEHAVQSATKILESIEEDLSNLTEQDIADIIDYFTESVVLRVDLATTEGKDALNRYWATETVILTYLISEHRKGNITLTEDQLSRAETVLENTQRLFGTGLVVWRDALHKLDPAKVRNERIANSIKIEISETSMDELSNAMNLEPGKVYSETQLRRLIGDAAVNSLKLNYIPEQISVEEMETELNNYYDEQIDKFTEQGKQTTDRDAQRLIAEKLGKAVENKAALATASNDKIYNMYTELATEIHKEYALTLDQKQSIVSHIMRSIENEVLQGYNKLGKKGKQKLVDKIIDWERTMMLSSPGTLIRNWASNQIIKYTTKAAGQLGSAFNKRFMRKAYNKNEAYMIDNMVNTSQAVEIEIADLTQQMSVAQTEFKSIEQKANKEIGALNRLLKTTEKNLEKDVALKQSTIAGSKNVNIADLDKRIANETSQIEKLQNEIIEIQKKLAEDTLDYRSKIEKLSARLKEVRVRRTETVQGLDIAIDEAIQELNSLKSMTKEQRENGGMTEDTYKQQIKTYQDTINDLKDKRNDLMKKKQYRITGTKVDADTQRKVKDLFTGEFYSKTNSDGKTVAISFYDAIADGLSRYSDRTYNPLNGNKKEAAGDQIVELIVNTMTSKIFNDNRFTSKSDTKFWQKVGGVENFVNKLLFKVLSDNPWIKQRTEVLYGKMITELGLDTDNLYTRASLQCFADAYVYACWEYMHRRNFFTTLEQYFHEKSSAAYFIYKQIAPFASASWNWCMEALNYTPIGMAKGMYKILSFEKQVNKMSEQKTYGSIEVSSNFTLYEAQKTLGKGLLGTLLFTIGAVGAGIGLFAIDDEDDTIKLKFSDSVYLDVTDLFGTSGLLLGAAMVSGIQDAIVNGMSFNKFWSILGQMSTSLLNDTIFNSIFESASYSDSIGDYFIDTLVDSFGKLIPNVWKVFSKIVNSGVEVKYESGVLGSLEYLVTQILPGIAYAMPKKYDIWTGELKQDHPLMFLTTTLNELSPVNLDIYVRSEAEKVARSIGLSKSLLTGNYDDIGKLDNYQVQYLNKMYGQLNAQYLEDFVNNKTKYKVQNEKGTYETLLYSQMTSEQIKSVINRIMTNDATYAKIYVYTNYMNGKYYADEDTYTILKKLGISKNVYRESTKYSGYV